jgi:hypothetical protein
MNEQHRLEQAALASLTEDDCPDADHLAAYILGTSVETEQLIVAAHVRECPLCQHDISICRPPERRQRPLLARFMPLALADGLRSSTQRGDIRRYVVADIVVELTITPPIGDYWRVTGQVARAGRGLAGSTVILRTGRRRYQQTNDSQGFFTFEELPAGRYTVFVADDQVQIQIRALELKFDLI